jgi:hypothetical protein
MAGIAAGDIGGCAYGIYQQGSALAGKRIGIAGEHVSGADMAAKMSRALGSEVAYAGISADMFRSFGFPGAVELGNMFQFYDEYEKVCNDTRDVAASRALNPALQSFDQWLAANAKKIPLE